MYGQGEGVEGRNLTEARRCFELAAGKPTVFLISSSLPLQSASLTFFLFSFFFSVANKARWPKERLTGVCFFLQEGGDARGMSSLGWMYLSGADEEDPGGEGLAQDLDLACVCRVVSLCFVFAANASPPIHIQSSSTLHPAPVHVQTLNGITCWSHHGRNVAHAC